jgi:hypothetical protein
MSIPPIFILAVYLLGVVVFIVVALIHLYHIIRFGLLGIPSMIASILFFAVAVGLVLLTLQGVSQVDWRQPLPLTLPITNTSQ